MHPLNAQFSFLGLQNVLIVKGYIEINSHVNDYKKCKSISSSNGYHLQECEPGLRLMLNLLFQFSLRIEDVFSLKIW